MARFGSWPLVVIAAVALGGCLRKFVPAPFGTPLDEVCNPMNGALSEQGDTHTLGRAIIPVTRGWTRNVTTAQELQLRRVDAELNVWLGPRFVFPALEPRNAVRCTLARGDTTISIQATRLEGFNYRVDVSWSPRIDGQFFYMQLQTRYVEHLKQMRGMVEAVRFVPDTVPARR